MLILQSLYFFLPAMLGNGVGGTLSAKLPIIKNWKTPVDFGKKFNGKRIFGDHKTIRGFVVGTTIGTITSVIQYLLYNSGLTKSLSLYDYSSFGQSILLGFLLGFGALAGDAIKSFFKRQVGIAPGKPWIGFDQLDYVVGGLVFSNVIYNPDWKVMGVLFIACPVLHFISNYIAYKLKLKDVWY